MKTRPLIQQFEPYSWEPSTSEIARRYGLRPSQVARLDLNTSPYTPKKWLAKIAKNLEKMQVNLYPDTSYRALREDLSKYTGMDVERFVITNGADEALDIVAKTFLDQGSAAVISAPTYSYFRVATELMGGRAIFVQRREDFSDDIEGIIAACRAEEARLVFLCSPNNPTGNTLDEKALRQVLEESDATVVVDEAYYEYCGKTFAKLTNSYSNLIIVRTFSKAFALAGARVGYIIAAEETVRELNKARPPNSLSIISLALASTALRDLRHLKQMVSATLAEKERLHRALQKHSTITAYPSEANFILIKLHKHNADEVHEKLMQHGLVVRNLAHLKGLENCLRISIGLPAQNNKLIRTLNKILAG